jgi:hypothetical protein
MSIGEFLLENGCSLLKVEYRMNLVRDSQLSSIVAACGSKTLIPQSGLALRTALNLCPGYLSLTISSSLHGFASFISLASISPPLLSINCFSASSSLLNSI